MRYLPLKIGTVPVWITSFFIIMVVLFSGCVQETARKSNKLQVVATIFPLYDMAREVGQDKIEVSKLLPTGVEAHTFEPRPRDIVGINRADIFIYTGKYMEPWVDDLLKGVKNKNLLVVDTSQGIDLMGREPDEQQDTSGDSHEYNHHGGQDPHIWLDLAYAQKMTRTIADALAKKDPGHKNFYLENSQKYQTRLAALDARYRNTLATARMKTIIYAGHNAFGYLAGRYGLKFVSPYRGFSPDAEPAPKSIRELIETIKKTGARYIYYEELMEPRVARVIAEETGARLELLNAAHNVSRGDLNRGVTFLSIMEDNLQKLKAGLECR